MLKHLWAEAEGGVGKPLLMVPEVQRGGEGLEEVTEVDGVGKEKLWCCGEQEQAGEEKEVVAIRGRGIR